ncbi:MAG TPA: SLAC1 anion channel family protein, partial [Deltaproteobacteria bacterium]|nr:SLAC1 anion channel family protein [Deltaproteobacteria bacterium]
MDSEPGVSSRLALFPVSFFSVTMGLGGLALATRKMESALGLPGAVFWGVLGVDIAVFTALILLYAAKVSLYPKDALREMRHPVKMSFAPSVSIGMVLISAALIDSVPGVSRALWLAGAGLQLILSLAIMREWVVRDHFEIVHASPSWFIPAVGNLVVPLAGMRFAPLDVSWFYFSSGIVMWGVLLAIVLSRAIFHRSLPEKLLPTLFILMAPPSVGFLVYVRLTGGL